jgi:hypothetical protein
MQQTNKNKGILALKEELQKVVNKYNYEAHSIKWVIEQAREPYNDFEKTAFVQRETTMRILKDLEELLQ